MLKPGGSGPSPMECGFPSDRLAEGSALTGVNWSSRRHFFFFFRQGVCEFLGFGLPARALVQGPRLGRQVVWARGARRGPCSRRRGCERLAWLSRPREFRRPDAPGPRRAPGGGERGPARPEEAQAPGARGRHVVGGRRGVGATSGALCRLVTREPGILGLPRGCGAGSGR